LTRIGRVKVAIEDLVICSVISLARIIERLTRIFKKILFTRIIIYPFVLSGFFTETGA
jgi:hypothetical protein